jgi:chromosome partitioning protein
MQTIALVTQKGGSGKSTLAIGLAIAALQDGHQVRLLDTDPQGTLTRWRRRRTHPEPIVESASDGDQIHERLRAFADNGATLTVIDTASGESDATRAAMRAADLCVIPARPSQADLESTVHTFRTIRQLEKPFAFVLSQTPIRGHRSDDAASALSATACSLSAAGVLALPYVALRTDHLDALAAGLAVTEYAHDGKSADEIRGLWRWVAEKLSAGPCGGEQTALPHAAAALPFGCTSAV